MGEIIDHSKSVTHLLATARDFNLFKNMYKEHLLSRDWLDLDSLELYLSKDQILIPVYMVCYELAQGKYSSFWKILF